ncbi:hypothetical protein AAG906_038282 [Vitis piasezkii]
MSKQSNSRSFLKAMEEALAKIGRHVELEMTCSCTPKEIRIGLSRSLTVNAGVKEGVVMPEGGIRKFSVTHFEPAEFLSGLQCIAQVVAVTSMLEFLVLKSQMSAFGRSKGPHHQLTVYHEPQEIAGLEEKVGNGGDSPSYGQVFTIPVAPGDVVIAGTDGLFHNLYNNEVLAVVVHTTRARLGPQVITQKIAALARQRAHDKNRQTPFFTATQDVGFRYYGGKLDDITVIVSYITSHSNGYHSSNSSWL